MTDTTPDDQDQSATDEETLPPGPADHGGEGGMATRELAPDVAEGSGEPPD